MLAGLALLSALVASPLQVPPPPQSIYKQVIENPTGRNGYEEYCAAADLMNQWEISWGYSAWIDPNSQIGASRITDLQNQYANAADDAKPALLAELVFARHLAGLDFLDAQREFAAKGAEAISLVEQGNKKVVFDPRPQTDAFVGHPEFAPFKRIAKLFSAASYASFASGNGILGSRYLCDDLVFAQDISKGDMIAMLVGIACKAIALSQCERQLSRIPIEGWDELSEIARQELFDKTVLPRAYEKEQRAAEGLLSSPDVFKVLLADYTPYLEAAEKLPAAQITQLLKGVRTSVDETYAQIQFQLQQPEDQWWSRTPAEPNPDIDTVDKKQLTYDDVSKAVIAAAQPLYVDDVARAVMVSRTQLRLLILHAKIHSYEWRTGNLPSRLKDVASSEEIHDPLSGKSFRYVKTDQHQYTLQSLGRAETGPVELKYRRPLQEDLGHHLGP